MASATTCQTKHRVMICTPQSQKPLTIVSGPTSDLTKNGKTMHSALVNAIKGYFFSDENRWINILGYHNILGLFGCNPRIISKDIYPWILSKDISDAMLG